MSVEPSDEFFSHIANIHDHNMLASFTTHLNDAIVTHTLTSKVPRCCFGDKSHEVIIDTGESCGSNVGIFQ